MWGKTLAFIILFILAFSALIAIIPTYFLSGDESIQDQDALTALTAANLIIYTSTGNDNMTEGYSSYTDGPSPPNWNVSLPEGEYLEVWWGQNPVYGSYAIELRHIGTAWWGGPSQIDKCNFYYPNGTMVGGIGWSPYTSVVGANLAAAWDSDINSSVFTASCDHISISIVFKPDGGYTDIEESFDEGFLWYAISYEWDADDTGFNVMNMMVKLLSFQGVGVGVPGVLGAFIDAVISTLFWIAIAVVAYVVITAIIPFIPGVGDS